MSDLATESYPEGGRDWIDPSILPYADARNTAMTEELYTHTLADVRRQFFGKL